MSAPRWWTFLAIRLVGEGLYKATRLVSFLSAGFLDRAGLRRGIEDDWADFLADERDVRSGFWQWERDFYTRFVEPGSSLLIVGAGAGRDLLAFLGAGHRAEGVELSRKSSERGRQILKKSGVDATIHTAAIEEWTPAGRYDAIVFSWYCYSYIPVRQNRVAVLAKLREHLVPGGRILLSYIPLRGSPSRGMPIVAWLTWLTRSDWRPEPGDDLVTSGPISLMRFEHAFRSEEIEAEMVAAGLRVAHHAPAPEAVLVLERADP